LTAIDQFIDNATDGNLWTWETGKINALKLHLELHEAGQMQTELYNAGVGSEALRNA
jgi:hypothetical protein